MATVTNSDESRIEIKRPIEATRIEDGYGLLFCRTPGERRLGDFDVAEAMRKEWHDRAGHEHSRRFYVGEPSNGPSQRES